MPNTLYFFDVRGSKSNTPTRKKAIPQIIGMIMRSKLGFRSKADEIHDPNPIRKKPRDNPSNEPRMPLYNMPSNFIRASLPCPKIS